MSERMADEGGYHTIDLDDPKTTAPDLEIENVEDEAPEPDNEPEVKSVPAPTKQAVDDDDEPEVEGEGGKKRLTRSQRLKMARDAAMQELAAEREKSARLESELTKRRGEAVPSDHQAHHAPKGIRSK